METKEKLMLGLWAYVVFAFISVAPFCSTFWEKALYAYAVVSVGFWIGMIVPWIIVYLIYRFW